MNQVSDLSNQMIQYCQRMDRLGWVANHDGNMSVRLDRGRLLMTPTARSKANLRKEDLIEVDTTGNVVRGSGKPFSELALHLKVFEHRSEVGAVVHSHAPYAMAAGLANQEMSTAAIPEAVVSLGPGIPLVSLALPNSKEVFDELNGLLPHYDAVMIAGNGILSWGKDMEQAFLRMELVEHLAKCLTFGLQIGKPLQLSPDQVSALLKKREKAGLALPPDPKRPHWFPNCQS